MYCFETHIIDTLPKLAWVAEVDSSNKKVIINCGSKVEVRDNFFVAGVWDREFSEAEFDASDAFYGTGCKFTDDGIVFSTPSHTIERLQYYDMDDRFVVSNSLAFLMEYCELELDPSEDQYEAYFCSVLDGLDEYKTKIPMKDGKHIHIAIASNILVDEKLKVTVNRRPKMEPFSSFDNYYSRLMKSFEMVKMNATSKDRKNNTYGVVSTISSGYDSTCCSVVAKKLGGDKVVSLIGGSYEEDDGTSNAKKLGFANVIRRNKDNYKKDDNNIDAEYIASGEIGTMLQFSVFEDVLADNIVFWGVRGTYWKKKSTPCDNYKLKDYYYYETDVSWTENALKNGYICVPLPAFGASECASIKEVSNAEEMLPWNIDNYNNKPIPRRIVEEAGIDREDFGQTKRGGGFYLGYETVKGLKKKMSKVGYENFLEYRKGYRHTRPLRRLGHGIKYYKTLFPTFSTIVLSKVGIKTCMKQKTPRIANPYAPCELFFWSIEVIKGRYKKALKGEKQ